MELYEKGILTKDDLDGLDLTWGNMDAVIALIPKIAYREGFGDTPRRREPEGSPEDRRRRRLRGLGQGAGPPHARPAGVPRHGACLHDVEPGGLPPPACRPGHRAGDGLLAPALPHEGRLPGDDERREGRARLPFRELRHPRELALHLPLSHRHPEAGDDPGCLQCHHRLEPELQDLLQAGMRDWTLKRGFNNLLGITVKDDVLPKRIMTALEEGGGAGSVPDVELLRKSITRSGVSTKGASQRKRSLPSSVSMNSRTGSIHNTLSLRGGMIWRK